MKYLVHSIIFFLLLCTLPASAFAKKRTLVLYSFAGYIPPRVLKQFEKETGIRVSHSTYESNEAMFAKLQLIKGIGYDVILPSTYFIRLLKEHSLLHKLDKTKLPNFSNLNPFLIDLPFDRNNDYTIPHMWGSTVLLMNSKMLDIKKITSWNDLFLPECKKYVFLSNDMRDSFSIALMALGFSPNSTNKKEISSAGKWLEKLMPSVHIFDITTQKQAFISEEVYIGTVWNGDAFIAMQENPALVAIYPKEGTPMWIDSFAIPIGAKNISEAHEFINFMLRPEIAVQCVLEFAYSTPNNKALPLLPPNFRESPLINPSVESIKKMKIIDDLGDSIKDYDRIWEKIKAQYS